MWPANLMPSPLTSLSGSTRTATEFPLNAGTSPLSDFSKAVNWSAEFGPTSLLSPLNDTGHVTDEVQSVIRLLSPTVANVNTGSQVVDTSPPDSSKVHRQLDQSPKVQQKQSAPVLTLAPGIMTSAHSISPKTHRTPLDSAIKDEAAAIMARFRITLDALSASKKAIQEDGFHTSAGPTLSPTRSTQSRSAEADVPSPFMLYSPIRQRFSNVNTRPGSLPLASPSTHSLAHQPQSQLSGPAPPTNDTVWQHHDYSVLDTPQCLLLPGQDPLVTYDSPSTLHMPADSVQKPHLPGMPLSPIEPQQPSKTDATLAELLFRDTPSYSQPPASTAPINSQNLFTTTLDVKQIVNTPLATQAPPPPAEAMSNLPSGMSKQVEAAHSDKNGAAISPALPRQLHLVNYGFTPSPGSAPKHQISGALQGVIRPHPLVQCTPELSTNSGKHVDISQQGQAIHLPFQSARADTATPVSTMPPPNGLHLVLATPSAQAEGFGDSMPTNPNTPTAVPVTKPAQRLDAHSTRRISAEQFASEQQPLPNFSSSRRTSKDQQAGVAVEPSWASTEQEGVLGIDPSFEDRAAFVHAAAESLQQASSASIQSWGTPSPEHLNSGATGILSFQMKDTDQTMRKLQSPPSSAVKLWDTRMTSSWDELDQSFKGSPGLLRLRQSLVEVMSREDEGAFDDGLISSAVQDLMTEIEQDDDTEYLAASGVATAAVAKALARVVKLARENEQLRSQNMYSSQQATAHAHLLDEERAAHNKALADMRRQRSTLELQIEQLQAEISMQDANMEKLHAQTKEQSMGSLKHRAQQEAQIAELQEANARLKQDLDLGSRKLAEQASDHARALQQIQQKDAATVQQLQQQLQLALQNANAAANHQQQEHESDLQHQQQEHDAAVQELKQQLALAREQITQNTQDHQSALQQLQAKHTAALILHHDEAFAQLLHEHEVEIQDMKQQHEAAIQQMQHEHQVAIAQLQSDFAAATSQLQLDCDAQVAQVTQQLQDALTELQDLCQQQGKHKDMQEAVTAQAETDASELQRQLEAASWEAQQLQARCTQLQEQREQEQAAHSEAVLELLQKRESATWEAQQAAARCLQLEAQMKDLRKELAAVTQSHITAMDELQQVHKATLDETARNAKQHDLAVQQLQQQLETSHRETAAHQQALLMLQKEHDLELKQFQQQHAQATQQRHSQHDDEIRQVQKHAADETAHLRQQLAALHDYLAAAKEQEDELKSLQDEVKDLQWLVEQGQERHAEAQQELEMSRADRGHLEGALADSSRQAELLKSQVAVLQSDKQQLTQWLDAARQQEQQQERQLVQAEAAMHELQQAYEHQQQQLEDSELQLQQLQVSYHDQQQQLHEAESQLQQLQLAYKDQQHQLGETEAQLQQLQAVYNELHEQTAEAAIQSQHMQAAYECKQLQCEQAEAQLEELQAADAEQKQQLQEVEAKLQQQQSQLQRQQQLVEGLQEERDVLHGQLQHAQRDAESWKTSCTQLREQVSELQDALEVAYSERRSLQVRLAEYTQNSVDRRQQTERQTQAAVRKHALEVSRLQSELNSAQARVHELAECLFEREDQLVNLQKHVSQLTVEYNETHAELQRLQVAEQHLMELRQKLAASESDKQQLVEELSHLQHATGDLHEHCEHLSRQLNQNPAISLAESTSQSDEHVQQLIETTQKLEAAESARRQLEDELLELQRAAADLQQHCNALTHELQQQVMQPPSPSHSDMPRAFNAQSKPQQSVADGTISFGSTSAVHHLAPRLSATAPKMHMLAVSNTLNVSGNISTSFAPSSPGSPAQSTSRALFGTPEAAPPGSRMLTISAEHSVSQHYNPLFSPTAQSPAASISFAPLQASPLESAQGMHLQVLELRYALQQLEQSANELCAELGLQADIADTSLPTPLRLTPGNPNNTADQKWLDDNLESFRNSALACAGKLDACMDAVECIKGKSKPSASESQGHEAVARLHAELLSTQQQLEETQTKLDATQAKLIAAQVKLDEALSDLKDAQASLAASAAANEAHMNERRAQDAVNARLQASLTQAEQLTTELSQQRDAAAARCAKLTEYRQQLQGRVSELELQLQEASELRERGDRLLKSYAEKDDAMQVQLVQYEQERDSLQADLEAAQNLLRDLADALAATQDQVTSLVAVESENTELKHTITQLLQHMNTNRAGMIDDLPTGAYSTSKGRPEASRAASVVMDSLQLEATPCSNNSGARQASSLLTLHLPETSLMSQPQATHDTCLASAEEPGLWHQLARALSLSKSSKSAAGAAGLSSGHHSGSNANASEAVQATEQSALVPVMMEANILAGPARAALLSRAAEQLRILRDQNRKMVSVLRQLGREGSLVQQLDTLRKDNKELVAKYTASQLAHQQCQRAVQRLGQENASLAGMLADMQAKARPMRALMLESSAQTDMA